MAIGPNSNDVVTNRLPWRYTTPLHTEMGAQCRTGIVQTVQNKLVTIADFKYTPQTMDRVIGVRITNPNLQAAQAPAGAVQAHNTGYLYEANTDFYFSWNYVNFLFCAYFNVETYTDGITLQIMSATTGWLSYSLYNFEIGQTLLGR